MLFVVGGVVVVYVIAGQSLAVVVLFVCGYRGVGRLSSFWAAGLVRGGVGYVTWHAGDMEGASIVVDAGNMAVWLSDWFVRW